MHGSNDRPAPSAARGYALAALAALPVAFLLALRPWDPHLPAALYLPVHTTLEILVVSAGVATFAVQWFAAGAGAFRETRALFVGPAILAASLLEIAHLLSFPGMPGFFGATTTERGIFYWLAARFTSVGALLAALRIKRGSEGLLLGRKRLLTSALVLVVAVVVVELSLPVHRAWFFDEGGGGLTRLKLFAEALVLAAALVGALLHARRWRHTREPASGKVALALAMGVHSEACFMLYEHAYDPFNVLGHVYLVVSFWFVFDALFVAALVRPYRELDALRAHVEDELVVTIRRLRHTTEQREDLLRAVSHDLRNPLQIVLLQAQRLQRAPEGDPARRPAAAILAASRRMERMLRDLADAARSESGKLDLETEHVSLRPFVFDLLKLSEGAIDAGRVENAVPVELPAVLADPDRLDRILANLLGNALKYSPGTVVVHADVAGAEVRVSVQDRGPGIAPADLPRIFERYYRGQRHEGEGLGLGLFIVRKLVEAHGGRVTAVSRPGEGSTFTFTLPVAPDPAS